MFLQKPYVYSQNFKNIGKHVTENSNSGKAEVGRNGDRWDEALDNNSERAPARSTRTDLTLVPLQTLEEFYRERIRLIDVSRIGTIGGGGEYLVFYGRNS